MEIFVVQTLNAHFNDNLLSVCQAYQAGEYAVYESVYFIEGTGYVQTVAEEIDLVLSSNPNNVHLQFDNFVASWGFEKYLHHNLSELSGGWRKYLGLALFTNLRTENKIYIDACRQLSDRLIGILLENLAATSIPYAFFFEYDSLLVTPSSVSYLYLESGSIVTRKPIRHQSMLEETNYEYAKNQ
jgi:hypothetical protein